MYTCIMYCWYTHKSMFKLYNFECDDILQIMYQIIIHQGVENTFTESVINTYINLYCYVYSVWVTVYDTRITCMLALLGILNRVYPGPLYTSLIIYAYGYYTRPSRENMHGRICMHAHIADIEPFRPSTFYTYIMYTWFKI